MITADHRAGVTRPQNFNQTVLDMLKLLDSCIHDENMNAAMVIAWGSLGNDVMREYRKRLKGDTCPPLPLQ